MAEHYESQESVKENDKTFTESDVPDNEKKKTRDPFAITAVEQYMAIIEEVHSKGYDPSGAAISGMVIASMIARESERISNRIAGVRDSLEKLPAKVETSLRNHAKQEAGQRRMAHTRSQMDSDTKGLDVVDFYPLLFIDIPVQDIPDEECVLIFKHRITEQSVVAHHYPQDDPDMTRSQGTFMERGMALSFAEYLASNHK